MNINFTPTGTPVSYINPGMYYCDFIFDPSKQSSQGYIATATEINQSQYSFDIFDINNDGTVDSYAEKWIEYQTGNPLNTSGTLTWEPDEIFIAHPTIGATPNMQDTYGRLAYDSQGNVTGINFLDNKVVQILPAAPVTADPIQGDALIGTFNPGVGLIWSLLDNDGNGIIDQMTLTWRDGIIHKYSMTWDDPTHWTARTLSSVNCLTFDAQGCPTSFGNRNYSSVPITWLATKAADNSIATFETTSTWATGEIEHGKAIFYDTNGDSQPDQLRMFSTITSSTGTQKVYTVGNIIGWASLNPANPTMLVEFQTGADVMGNNPFSGSITGTSSNPSTIEMASYFMGGGSAITSQPTTTTDAAGNTTIVTGTIHPENIIPEVIPLVTDLNLADPIILNVSRPQGVSFRDKVISGTAITDVRANLLASVGTTLAADTAIQNGIDAYLATPGLVQANVTVRTLTFSAPSSVSAGSLIVDGNAGHQEALVIDTTNLPTGSQIDLNNVDFAVIIGDNITVRGGAGANLVYAGIGAQDIKLGVDDDTIHGGDGNDNIASTTGNDWLYGDAGNDTLTGGADDDHLDGGAGDDTAVFTGSFADYNISYNSGTDTYTIADRVVGRDGTDMVTGVEHFLFGTTTMAVADIYAPGHGASNDTETIVAGVAWVGLLAWLIL